MSNELTVQQSESELISVLQSSLYPGASIPSVKMVLGYCKAAGLDPLQKPVHIVPLWDSKDGAMRDVVMPGIGLYRTQASRSGVFAGISEPEFGNDVTETIGGVEITYPAWCRVIAKRELPSGKIAEFAAIERWKENYAVRGGKEKSIAPNAMWLRRPYGQISKCAQAQALRLAFPELGAAPTADEMEGKEFEREINPAEQPKSPVFYPQDKFMAGLPKWSKHILVGAKTAEEIIGWLQTKCPLTDAQQAAIKAVKKAAPEPVGDAGNLVITYAHVAGNMNSAKTIDALAEAADLIGEVADAEQRKELGEIYKQRQYEMKGNPV